MRKVPNSGKSDAGGSSRVTRARPQDYAGDDAGDGRKFCEFVGCAASGDIGKMVHGWWHVERNTIQTIRGDTGVKSESIRKNSKANKNKSRGTTFRAEQPFDLSKH